jgi:hypothetical protein
MQLDSGQWIVIGICAILIAGYAGGYYTNRRLAEQVVAWLYKGLKRWGELKAGGRLGGLATGGRLYVKNAGAPFKTIEAIFMLSPRENLIFWLFDLLRGQKDMLVLNIDLRTAPKKNLFMEAGQRGDKDFQQAIESRNLQLVTPVGGALEIALPDKDALVSEPMSHFLERYGEHVIRWSIRKQAPHMVIRARLKPMLQRSPEEYFSAIQELFQQPLIEN